MKRMMLVGLLIVSGLSCGPKIRSFEVDPLYVKSGDTINVSWNVRGEARLAGWRGSTASADTDGPSAVRVFLDSVPSKGTKRYGLDESLEVNLYAIKGKDTTYKPIQAWVFPGEAWLDTLYLPTEALGADSILAKDRLDSKLPEFVLIDDIWMLDGRGSSVEHAGKNALLLSNLHCKAFSGLPASGDWTLRSTLLPNEQDSLGSGGPEELELVVSLYLKKEH